MSLDRALALTPDPDADEARPEDVQLGPRAVEPGHAARAAEVPIEVVADLMDLVATGRPDLAPVFQNLLEAAEPARGPAAELAALVAACDTSDAAAPGRAALAIAADLDVLIAAGDAWNHPAQVLKCPAVQALRGLCAARLETASGTERERLEEIRPRLERAAELERKAAVRRSRKGSGVRTDWVQGWL